MKLRQDIIKGINIIATGSLLVVLLVAQLQAFFFQEFFLTTLS